MRRIFSNYLSKLQIQFEVIEFANDFIFECDINTVKDNDQESKLLPTEKLNFCHPVPLCHILSMNYLAPLWHMPHKKAEYVTKKKEKFQFQVGYLSFPT